MDFADFVRGISFRRLDPQRHRPSGLRGATRLLARVGVDLERANTALPPGSEAVARRVSALRTVPRMSTFAVGAVINRAVDDMPAGSCFLNIGCWNGYTFFAGMAGHPDRRCVGVDNFCHPNAPKAAFLKRWERLRKPAHAFVEADFRDYLKAKHRDPIGVYVFDGPHTYEDQYDALVLAEPHFADGCVIVVDDTNHEQVRRANLDFVRGSRNGYELLLDERTAHNGHPTWWNGLMVFRLLGRNVAAARTTASRPAADALPAEAESFAAA